MELFSVQCATCKARLKVRDLAAIGQILACPKCGSMVQVAPPPNWTPPSSITTESADGGGETASVLTPLEKSSATPAPSAVPPTAADKPAAEPATTTAPTENPTTAEPSTLSAEGRRRGLLLVGSVLLILLSGVVAGFVIRTIRGDSRDPSVAKQTPRHPAADSVIAKAKGNAVDVQPDAPHDDAPPGVLDNKLVPHDTRLLMSFRLADSPGSSLSRYWFEFLAPIWSETLAPIEATLGQSGNPVVRFSWLASQVDGWTAPGIAVLEFRDPLPKSGPLVPDSTLLDWKIDGAIVYAPPPKTWSHPYVVVDDRKLVTGPEDVLKKLAPHVPAPADASRTEPDDADTTPVEQPTSSDEAEKTDESVAEPDEVAETTVPQPDGSNAASKAGPAGLVIPPAHDLMLVLDLSEATEQSIEAWSSLGKAVLPQEEAFPASLVSAVSLAVDCDEAGAATVDLSFHCQSVEAGAQCETRLREFLDRAQQATGELAKGKKAGSSSNELARISPVLNELLERATVTNRGPSIQVAATAAPGVESLGIVAISQTVAIEDFRRAATLALGEPRLAGFVAGLVQGANSEQVYPPAAAGSALLPAESRLSWIATLLPYYGHDDWRKQLNLARSWEDPQNQPVTRQPLPAAINPVLTSRRTPEGYPLTHYVGISGYGLDAAELSADSPRAGVFGNVPRRLEAVTDGAANTIAIMGVREKLGPWSAGGAPTVRALVTQPYVNGPDGFGTGQADGMYVGMADGSVRFVSADVDPKVLEQLATIRGGESAAIAAIDPKPLPKVEGPAHPDLAPPDAPSAEPVAEQAPSPRGGGIRDVDVPQRLADRIVFLQVDRMPLAEFLRLIDELTTLSVTIDFDRIGTQDIAHLPITLKVENKTVQELLDQALAEHGLVLRTEADQLLVQAADSDAKPESVGYDVADLVPAGERDPGGSNPEKESLTALLKQLVAPSTWDKPGEGTASLTGGKLVVEQPPVIQRQIAEFLERLRVARGKRRLKPEEIRARLASPWVVAKEKLAPQITVNFPDDTPLTTVLGYLREKAGIDFVVDWNSLRAVEIGPGVIAGLHIDNQRLDNTLDSLLAPLGLAMRPIDPRTVEITTPDKLKQTPVMAFYPLKTLVASGQSAEVIAERLRNEVSPASWQGGDPALTVFDRPSGYLIVRGPAPLLRQVDLAFSAWNAAAAEKQAKPGKPRAKAT